MVDVSRLGAFHGFVDQAAYEADQADRERRRQAAESRKAVGVGWYVSILSSVECTGDPEPDLAEQLQASLDAVADDPGRPFDA